MIIEKKKIRCNLCDADSFRLIYDDELGETLPSVDYDFSPNTRKTFAIVRCENCRLMFTNPMPELQGAYEDVVDPVYLASEKQRRKTAQTALSAIRSYAPAGGRLLDVGCNTGLFLDEAAQFFEVEGVELSRWAAAKAAQNHKVHTIPISKLDFHGTFDVITLFGVIEHFTDPAQELQAIASALKPGGLFVVYTGDVQAWLPRLLGKKWWWFQGMHLFYFSLQTLSLLLKRTGFDIIGHTNYTVYFQLFSLAKSLNRYAIGRILSPILNHAKVRDRLVGLKLSGEMLVFARRKI